MINAEAGPSATSEPHRMRITSGGSIKHYVTFALDFLQNNPSRALVLHTLPPTPAPSASTSPSTHSSTLTVPRLITIVEIIKREIPARFAKEGRGKGKHRAVGVWQYTETGLVPENENGTVIDRQGNERNGETGGGTGDLTRVSSGKAGGQTIGQEQGGNVGGTGDLTRVLSGKTQPKMTHHPYLQITLSTRPLHLERDPTKGVTCQHVVLSRRRSKGKGKASDQEQGKASAKDGAAVGDDVDMDLGVPVAAPIRTDGIGGAEVELGVPITRDQIASSTRDRTSKEDKASGDGGSGHVGESGRSDDQGPQRNQGDNVQTKTKTKKRSSTSANDGELEVKKKKKKADGSVLGGGNGKSSSLSKATTGTGTAVGAGAGAGAGLQSGSKIDKDFVTKKRKKDRLFG